MQHPSKRWRLLAKISQFIVPVLGRKQTSNSMRVPTHECFSRDMQHPSHFVARKKRQSKKVNMINRNFTRVGSGTILPGLCLTFCFP